MKKEFVNPKTVRLLMPQWQGGNNGYSYPLGARLLAWLAPESDAPLLEVPVEPDDGAGLAMEDSIVGRAAVVKQVRAARHLLDGYRPDRVITFGGDCLVSQAPFDYLNERYDGKLGVLWLDAHPDITTPRDYPNSHAMVLGNLLGDGDPGLAKEVRRPLETARVMCAGLEEMRDYETATMARLGLRHAFSDELKQSSAPVLQWIKDVGIEHVAIHFDVDVLDPKFFRSQLFNNPDSDGIVDASHGTMTLPQVTRLIVDVANQTDVVGISFAEHMPWDDINLMNMMDKFSFMK